MAKYPAGFLPYGSDDESLIIQADLTAETALDGGVLLGANPSYSEAGFNTNGTAGVIYTPTVAQRNALGISSYIHIEVDSGFLTEADTGSFHRLISLAGTASNYLANASPALFVMRLDLTYSDLGVNLLAHADRDGPKMKIDIAMSDGIRQVYVDGLLVIKGVYTFYATNFATLVIGGRSGGTEFWWPGYNISNFFLANRSIMIPKHPALASVVYLGDSITVQGNYVTAMPQLTGTTGIFHDHGWCPTVEKVLNKNGLGFTQSNHAVSGAAMAQLPTQVTAAILKQPTMAVIFIGANDVSGGTLTAGFETDYQTEITRLVTAGCKKIILVKIPSQNIVTSVSTEAAVDACNAAVDALVVANAECYSSDVFSVLGGHDIVSSDWIAEDKHPQATSHKKMGLQIANDIISVL